MSREDTRYERNECLICGDPLMRVDDIPCCSVCWDKVMKDFHNKNMKKKHMRWHNKGAYIKIFPNSKAAAT